MIELTLKQYSALLPLFLNTNYGVLAVGTLEGNHPGNVFADDLTLPANALVCTKVGYYFLAGNPDQAETLHSINELFRQKLAPEQYNKMKDPQILLFYEPGEWKATLFQTFRDFNPSHIQKKRMVLPQRPVSEYAPDWRSHIPQGMRMAPICLELLEQHPEESNTLKLFWGSPRRFVEKSLGFWLMQGDSIACSCEGVFIGKGEVEISIATPLGYRRRGFAQLTASAFIEACFERSLKPIWGCWPENLPSVSLAQSLGFVDDVVQDICFFEYHPHDK